MTRIGVVTGLAAEARCLSRSGGDFAVRSAGGAAAADAARRLIDDGATALLSFGLAGALDPALAPGALIAADTVIDPAGGSYHVDPDLRNLVAGAGALGGTLAGRDSPVTTVADKRSLFETTGAMAVDMESHRVARVAAERGVPFAVLRAIADPAWRELPAAALAGFGDDGGLRIGALLAKLAARPWELPALLMVARDAGHGLAALRCAGPALRRAGLASLGGGPA